MLEIIHDYEDNYPFNLQYHNNSTFIQVIQNYKDNQTLLKNKLKLEKFIKIENSSFIKLKKILKQDTQLHIIYQYFPSSLKQYIHRLKEQPKLLNIIQSLKKITDCLIQQKIVTQISFQNIIIASDECIKLFVHPQYQIFQAQNISELQQFYQLQRKKLQIDIEEIYQSKNGLLKYKKNNKMPNFLISGTSLMFLNEFSQQKIQCSPSYSQGKRQSKKSQKPSFGGDSTQDLTKEHSLDYDGSKNIKPSIKQNNQIKESSKQFSKQEINISQNSQKSNKNNSIQDYQKFQNLQMRISSCHEIQLKNLLQDRDKDKSKQQNSYCKQNNSTDQGKKSRMQQLQQKVRQAKLKSEQLMKGVQKQKK